MLKGFQNYFILSSGTPFALLLKAQEIPFGHQGLNCWDTHGQPKTVTICNLYYMKEMTLMYLDYQYHEMFKLSLFLQQEE